MMAKVSVIVPVYQVEKYLRKCLNSLVNQTLQDIEILVVNDGSTDGSQEIIDEFQEKYPLIIKSFVKENGGLSDARNYGIDRASGEFIGFVDSDDEVAETMFEEMYSLGIKNKAEIVVCNLQKVNEQGKVVQKLTQIPHMPEKIELKNHFSVFSDISYFACNKIFRNELFKDKRFKKGVHFEDIELIPKFVLDSTVIAQTQKYHYNYLERSDSITKTHSTKGLDILKAVEEVSSYFKTSKYAVLEKDLKNFQILEGVYTFLAYSAFVKEETAYNEMNFALRNFIKKYKISKVEILTYRRFGKNYLLSLPLKKQLYYLLYFTGLYSIVRKLL